MSPRKVHSWKKLQYAAQQGGDALSGIGASQYALSPPRGHAANGTTSLREMHGGPAGPEAALLKARQQAKREAYARDLERQMEERKTAEETKRKGKY